MKRVEDIYNQYVKGLSVSERLELLALVAKDLATQAEPSAKSQPRNIMELHGLGKEIWQGIDAQDYVNQIRQEWERRP